MPTFASALGASEITGRAIPLSRILVGLVYVNKKQSNERKPFDG